jgi:hypothetical protein
MRRRVAPASDAFPPVEVLAADAPSVPEDVVAIGPTRRYPRLARVAGRVPRRVVTLVGGAAVVVLVAIQVVHRDTVPSAAPVLPPSPLIAAACQSGSCLAEYAAPTDVAEVRNVLDSDYTVTGLLTRDPHGVLRQIQIVAADGVHVLTVRAAQADRAASSWAAPLSRIQRADLEWTVIRTILVSRTGHARWLIEVRTAGPIGSLRLLAAALALSRDDGLVR